jgi:hypothetical protein
MNQPQNPPPSSSLPHRLRKDTVEGYAKALAQIVDAYPSVVRFDPRPRALATFAARLRDARISLQKYQWELSCAEVNMSKFNLIHDEIVVQEGADGFCYVGSKELLAQRLTTPQGQLASRTNLVVNLPSDKTVQALAHLCAQRVFPQSLLPVQLIGPVSAEVIETCEAAYDVSFETREDGVYLV